MARQTQACKLKVINPVDKYTIFKGQQAKTGSLSAMWSKQHQLPVFPCRNQGHQLMAIHPATATLDSLLHLQTITISNTFTSSSHSKPMRTGLG
jgi:hypothetical protein